jgi:hypothetical protein
MTKDKTCPLGVDCDLTTAYMAGSFDARKKCESEIERLRAALEFYAKKHKVPSEGPWGIDSDDFGGVARAALEGK